MNAGSTLQSTIRKAQNDDRKDRLQRLLDRSRSRSLLPCWLMGAMLGIAIVMAGREVEQHIAAIESWIASLGVWSMPAFIGLVVVITSFLIPETVLAVIAGALFGLERGILVVIAGNLLAAALQFALAQTLLRAKIQKVLVSRPLLVAIQRAVVGNAFRFQVLLRLTPLNPATISYLLGVAGVRLSGFLIACLALTPNLFLEVYAGYAAKHFVRTAGLDARNIYLHDAMMAISLIVCVIVMVFVSKMARNAVLEAVDESRNNE